MSLRPEELQQEEQYLQKVLAHIERESEEAKRTAEMRKDLLVGGKKEFTEDIVYDADDWFEAAVQLTQQARELSQHARDYRVAQGRSEYLERLKSSPYFARFDFREAGSEREEKIYIGTRSLSDPETYEMYVYDWRAPIAGMYYDYGPGPASYEAPEGMVKGEMTLKRQFVIRGGKLFSAFDTGVTIGDEMLQRILGQNADDKMKSIVTTIQREQNRIIRETKRKYVFVQGAAGSGKTSAALQRIAYLLYRYRNIWNSDQFILFSPNDVFNDYVSNVLPELGEDAIPQSTFYDYVWRRLKHVRDVEHPYDQLEYLYQLSPQQFSEDIRFAGIRLKASLSFAEQIDAYAESLAERGVRFRSVLRKDKVIIPERELESMFYEKYKHMRMPSRISAMQEALEQKLDELVRKRAKAWYQKWSKEPKYLGTEQELKKMSFLKARKAYESVRRQVKTFGFIDIVGTYLNLFEAAKERPEELPVSLELWQAIADDTAKRLASSDMLPYEDAVPILYLLEAIHGASRMNRVRAVIIDEAQDYTPLQWAYLRRLFPNAGVTALGDISQAIHGTAPDEGHLGSANLFPEEETLTVHLYKSYRSTRQIVAFTTALLQGAIEIEPFERNGKKPELLRLASTAGDEEAAERISAQIQRLREEGFESIAIITKTMAECETAFQALAAQGMSAKKLTKDTKTFSSGLVVLPSYVSKGLEFDAVVVWDANRERYSTALDRKLLYTVCTRALHRLIVCIRGEASPFLADVPNELFNEL